MAIRLKLVANPGELSEETAHTIRVLQEQTFGHVYSPIGKMDDQYWWIAYDGKKPIGFCSMGLFSDRQAAFLSLSGVIPGYRGRGLQRRMIKAREKVARTLEGIDRIVSYASYDNIFSANNLIRTGYLLYAPEYLWGVKHAYYFQKWIKKESPASLPHTA